MWLTSLACAQYHANFWTAENGLPQNIIRGIAQTPDGYLWLATFNGLARFDGVRFKVFDKSNSPGIVSDRLSSMLETPDGDLWLNAAESKNLTRYHDGVFQTIPLQVNSFTEDGKGGLWILTATGIQQWSAAEQKFLPVKPLHGKTISSLQWDNQGFWTVEENTLECFLNGHILTFGIPKSIDPRKLVWAAIAVDETAWVETNSGRKFHLARSHATPLSGPESSSIIAPDGHAWTFQIGAALDRKLVDASSGIPEPVNLRAYYSDRDHNLWIGTDGSGLIQLQWQPIHVFSRQQGLPDRAIYPLIQDHTGDIWVGVWGAGLSRIHKGKVTTFTKKNGLHDHRIMSILEDRDHRIWVGSHGSLSLFDGIRFHEPFQVPLPGVYIVQSLLQDSKGALWIGTSNGLVARNGDQNTVYRMTDGLATNDVRKIIEAPDKSLWIAGYGGLTHLKDGRFTRWTEQDGLPSNNIRSLYLDHDDILWIGTYDGGIARMKNGVITAISVKNGLFNNGAFQILEDSRHDFWMSSNRGIYRVSRNDLNQFADGSIKQVSSIPYGKADGMSNVECNGGTADAGFRASDGRLFFPTQDGIAILDPSNLYLNATPPNVVVESYSVDQDALPIHGSIVVPANAEKLEVQYTALSLLNASQNNFRYRLEGLDSTWVYAGNRRSAYYSHLPPGTFHFHVIAANSNGIWNEKGSTVQVLVLAPFYRTTWFKVLCALVAAVALICFWNLRLRALRMRQQVQQAFAHQLISSQEAERKRIAADLHDSIGQRFVAIKNLGYLGLQSIDDGARTRLSQITGLASAGIDETREIAYDLRPVILDRLGLTKAIAEVLKTIASSAPLHIHSTLDDIDAAIPPDLQINMYRIVQEAFSNVLKHASATEVHLAMLNLNGNVLLTIQDNGHGFSTIHKTPGFGLTGISERAQLLGGTLDYTSGTSGTTLKVTIPVRLR
jgi:signal transduction histidine kinase/ligand-binding sensor domain-containing protein